MDIVKQLFLQLVLILLNAFFAATEIAVISLNEKKVRSRAEDGDKKAKQMLRMIEKPTQFLSTIQIGITLAGFLGSAFAADNFAERLSGFLIEALGLPTAYAGAMNAVSVVAVTLVLSFFTLVLGELVPKRVAMQHKEKLAEMVCPVITALAHVLRPVIGLLTVSTNGVLRLMGVDPTEKEEPVSEEDIVIMLDAGADEGSLDEDDIVYIKNVFKLDRLTAEDIMTHRKKITFISADATQEEILATIRESGYSRMPVYGESVDEIVGVLHVRDYLLGYKEPGFTIQQAMFDPTFVPETMHLDGLLKQMQEEHTHIVIVVNEYGVPSGVLTMEDIIEEIVGEIWDESDEEEDEIQQLQERVYRVLCTVSTDDFFDFFQLKADEESEAATVNGWLTERFERIPEQGDELTYENLKITVTNADELMTHEIRVEVAEAKEPQEEEE